MNHFSYEVMGKERVKNLQDEGMRNQAFHRFSTSEFSLVRGLPKFILILLGILGILELMVR
jgi:hypothetical protein